MIFIYFFSALLEVDVFFFTLLLGCQECVTSFFGEKGGDVELPLQSLYYRYIIISLLQQRCCSFLNPNARMEHLRVDVGVSIPTVQISGNFIMKRIRIGIPPLKTNMTLENHHV